MQLHLIFLLLVLKCLLISLFLSVSALFAFCLSSNLSNSLCAVSNGSFDVRRLLYTPVGWWSVSDYFYILFVFIMLFNVFFLVLFIKASRPSHHMPKLSRWDLKKHSFTKLGCRNGRFGVAQRVSGTHLFYIDNLT